MTKRNHNSLTDSSDLFPRNLPEREWVQFKSFGFSKPVLGVIYRNGGEGQCGVPLGGIGTGYVSIDLDGNIGEWTIFNNLVNPACGIPTKTIPELVPIPRQIHKSFLGLCVKDRTWILSLHSVGKTENVGNIHYWGHYPVADLEYGLDGPIQVGLRAWSPFIPGDSTHSNIPGAIFEMHLRNTSENVQDGCVTVDFPGPVENEVRGNSEFKRESYQGEFQGIVVSTRQFGWPAFEIPAGTKQSWHAHKIEDEPIATFEYVLGIIGSEKIRTGGSLSINENAWAETGKKLPAIKPNESGTSLSIDFLLRPKEHKVIHIVVSWYAPYWPVTPYINQYRASFNSALEVAEYLAAEHENLIKRVLSWQAQIYCEDALPDYLRDVLVNSLCLMTKGSCYVCTLGADPDRGLLSIMEAAGDIPLQETICVAWWGDFPITFFFPELRLGTLRALAAYQAPDGKIPFILGEAENRLDAPHYITQCLVNGIFFVQMVDRLCTRVGDKNLIKEFYPVVKRAIQYEMSHSPHDDGLLTLRSDYGHAQPWDGWNWKGNAVYIAGHWIAALQTTQRMAEYSGDINFAQVCQEWILKAQYNLEAQLWNDETGSYLLWLNPGEANQSSDVILAYQLDGEFHNAYLGISGKVFMPKRIKQSLKTIYQKCIKEIPAGAVSGANPDGTLIGDGPGSQPSAIWVNGNAILAALYAYKDHREIADELLHKTLSNLVLNRQLGWNFPQGFDDPEGINKHSCNYYWGMALWAIPSAFMGQNIAELYQDGELVDRVMRAHTQT